MFSSIAGLPLHPLIVHLAVVAAPTAAVLLVLWAVVPRWRRRLAPVTAGVAVVAAVAVFISKQSGEALAGDEGGRIADHAHWADLFTVATLAMAVVALATLVAGRLPALVTALGAVVAVVVGAAVLWTAVETGHAGAELVWAHKDAASGDYSDGDGQTSKIDPTP